MTDKTLFKVAKLYKENLEKHGTNNSAVGWTTFESQLLRFKHLSSIVLGNENKNITINDYGCGYGAHLDYLVDELKLPVAQYNGYDISKEMLLSAKAHLSNHSCKKLFFNESVISTTANYSFVSGTFNVRFEENKKSWEKKIKIMLDNVNSFSEKGFAFNMLSTYVDWEETHLYYGDTLFWFDFCKKNFSKYVTLIHDYPLYEWTMLVRK